LKTINHVDLVKIQNNVNAIKVNPVKAKKTNRIEGDWDCTGSSGPQFKAELQLESGKFTLEADSPSFLGGSGTRPGPLHYCIFGLTSCFASTFMTLAAMEGIVIETAHFVGECDVDFSKTFGLSENPIIENAKFNIMVKSDADMTALDRLSKLAEERCPGIFSLRNKIEVKTELRKA
jgi:uncharacterized OsmC-like protein